MNGMKKFIFYFIFLTISVILYVFFGNFLGEKKWLSHGKEHYALMKTIDELGGIDTITQKIEERLTKNPNDARGWIILGKIWLAEKKFSLANTAFKKAQQLEPDNQEINTLIQLSEKSSHQ